MIFREAIPADVPALLALRFATVENAITAEELEAEYGITAETIADGLGGPHRGWLCEEDGHPLGFSIGDGATGEVQVVAVLPEAEGRGIGGEVLRRVAAWLFECGHRRVWLRANPDATLRAAGFYRHLGWRDTGTRVDGEAILEILNPWEARK